MNKDYRQMWEEVKGYCERSEKQLLAISQKYDDPFEKKRLQGKSDGVGIVLQTMIRLENLNNVETYRPVATDDDVYTLNDFLEECKSRMFIDSDGSGYYMKDDMIYREDANPSDFLAGRIDRSYTHVVWFNK